MPFKKGHKLGKGRVTGVPNKRTAQWQVFTEHCLSGGLERFQSELDKLEKKDYVNAFLTLLEFHKPKLARTEITGDDGEDLIPKKITIEIVHKK